MYIIIFTIAIAIISGTYMVYTVYILYHIGFAKCLQYQSSKAPKMNIEKLDYRHRLIRRKMSVLKWYNRSGIKFPRYGLFR